MKFCSGLVASSRQFWTYEPKRHTKGSPFEAEWRSSIRRRRKRRRSLKRMTRKKPHQCLRWQGRGCELVRRDTGCNEVQRAVQCLLYFTLCTVKYNVYTAVCSICGVQWTTHCTERRGLWAHQKRHWLLSEERTVGGLQFLLPSTLSIYSSVFSTSFPFLSTPSSSICTSSSNTAPNPLLPLHFPFVPFHLLFFLLHLYSKPSIFSSSSFLPLPISLTVRSFIWSLMFCPDGCLYMLSPTTDEWNIFTTLPTFTKI